MSKTQFLGPRTLKTCSVPNFLIITGTKTKSWCSRYSTRFGNEMKLHWIPSPTLPDLPGSTTNHTIYPTWERHARCHTLARWSDHPPLHSFDVDLRWGRRGWDMVPSCGAPPPCQANFRLAGGYCMILYVVHSYWSWSKLNHILGIAQPPARCRCFTSHLVRFSWGLDFPTSLAPSSCKCSGAARVARQGKSPSLTERWLFQAIQRWAPTCYK